MTGQGAVTVRGWCPSVYEPMATGDGLLVRVKPRGSVLSAGGMRVVAREAARWGNGVVELTSRGSLQVRGLAAAGVAPFAAAMVAVGLASADAAAERRRNVIGTPLADGATAAVTEALERALEADRGLADLPAKFCFRVTRDEGAGPAEAGSQDGVRADVSLRVFADRAEIGCAGDVWVVALGEAAARAVEAARGFVGASRPSPRPSPGGRGGLVRVGAVAGGFGVGVPFGSAAAGVWEALADFAERSGDGRLWLTPSRVVLIAGARAAQGLEAFGLIVDPEDPLLRVAACPGAPACRSATVATRDLAARLRPGPGMTVHVSGCEKRCAHPGPASLTLVGRDGRFDVVPG